MSCPDWSGLAALRRQNPQEDAGPAGWAAAVLTLAALSASSQSRDRSPLELLAPSPAPLALAPLAPAAGPDAGHGQETLEGLNRPAARVYQMSGKDISVVWIVDKSLDV